MYVVFHVNEVAKSADNVEMNSFSRSCESAPKGGSFNEFRKFAIMPAPCG